jgi:nitrate reductase alpha subunit
MMKHGSFIATEKTVKAQQTGPTACRSPRTGYISNFRFGSQQSVTRNWHMPMHQTDTLFHKSKAFMSFCSAARPTTTPSTPCPKECLIRITKAEDGGPRRQGTLEAGSERHGAGGRGQAMLKYLAGGFAGKGRRRRRGVVRITIQNPFDYAERRI